MQLIREKLQKKKKSFIYCERSFYKQFQKLIVTVGA